jgi:hypothetical protein
LLTPKFTRNVPAGFATKVTKVTSLLLIYLIFFGALNAIKVSLYCIESYKVSSESKVIIK